MSNVLNARSGVLFSRPPGLYAKSKIVPIDDATWPDLA